MPVTDNNRVQFLVTCSLIFLQLTMYVNHFELESKVIVFALIL